MRLGGLLFIVIAIFIFVFFAVSFFLLLFVLVTTQFEACAKAKWYAR